MGHCQSKSLSIGKMNGGTIYVTNINHFNSETIKCKKKQNYEDFRHSSSTATVRNGWTNSESNVSVQAESCFCWNSEHSNNSNWFTKNNFQSAKKTNTESRLKKFKKKAQKFFGRNRSSSKFPIQVQESSIQSEAEHMLDISNRYVDESNLSVISDVNVSNVQEVTEQATDDRMSIQNGIQEVQPISQYAETEREEEGFPSPLLTRNKEFNTNHLKANYAVRKKFGIGSGESCSEPSEYEPFSNFTQSREDDTELKSVLCTGSQKEMCPLQLTDCAYTREKPVNERSQQQFNTQQQIRTASEFQDENSLKSTSTAGYSLGTMSSYRDDLLTQDFSSYEISRDSSQNIRCGIKDHLLEAENENSHLPGSVNSAESRVYINSESSTCENKNSVIKECRENNSEKACIVPHNPVKPFENSEGDFDGDDMVEKADLFLNFERERKDLKEFHSSDKEAYPKLGQHFRKTEYEDNSWGQLNADIKDVEVEMNHAEIKTLVSEFFDKSSFNIDRYFSQEKSVHTEQGDHRRNNFLPRDLSLHTESKSKDSFEPFFTAVDETYFGVTLVPDYFTRSHFRAQSDSLKSFPSFSHVYSRHRPSIKSQSELQPTTGEKSFDYIVPASETKNESIPDCVNKKCVASVTEDTDLSNTVCPEICVRNRENVFPNRKSRKEHKNTNRQKKTRQKNKASKPIHGLLEKTKNRHTRRRVKCKHVSESDSSKPKTSEEDQENLSQISVESGFWSASDTKRNASQIIMNDRSSDMDSHLDFNRKITSVKKKGRKRNICIKVFNKKALLKKTKRHFKRCPANEKNKKAFLKKIKRHFKRCPANEKKRTAKSVVREICVLERPLYVFALGSYFDRLSNGPPPSSEERMQCEWFRLATFHNYTGNGNALALARNGFYHDHTEGPTSSRCYLCDARHSNWEMFDDVSAEHRRRSPRCLFHENGGEVSVNIHGASALSVSSATVTASSITSVTAAVNETVISLRRTSGERECLTQQPTEDPENRDCYLLALSQPRTQRALGHSRHSYSTIIAPRIGIDPLNSGTTSSGTGCRLPGIRPFSILGGPVGAGAFAGLRTAESLQQSNAPSPSAEAAAGTRQTNPAPGAGGRTDPTITVVVDNPKHPDYVNIDSRVSSYQGWPDYLDQTPRQMSEAGFFYDGVTDSTRCYCCGGLRNWEPGDDPMLEHTRWFPHCEYINKLKGERYVAAVQRWHQEHGGESIPLQPTEDPESRDRSLLALSQPCTQRALGRTGQSYSTIIAPRRNNVATGFRSNVGIDPLNSGSSSSGTGSQLPGIRPSSLLGGPVGACTFSGLRTAGPNTGALTSFPRATEGLQQSNTPSPSVEAASGTRQTNPAPGAGGKTDPTITVVVDNPKHPDYVNIDSRVSSYQGWPEYLDQTQRQMSEAGFFYVGVADFTRCYCCGGGLRNWEPGDDPMLEHTRWFPHCEYVNKLKGERYVAAVQRRHQKHMAEQQRQQKEIAQRRDENRNPPDPMTTEAAAVMREMGYSVDRTKEAILAVRLQTGSLVVTTQQVLTWLQDEEESRLTGNSSNTGIRPPPTSTATSLVGTSTLSSVVYTGTSIPSSVVHRGTSIGTSIVNTTSSIYTATSIVSAGTATSTVSSSSGSVAAEVQQSCTSASVTAGESSSASQNQQTGSGNSFSSNSASRTSIEKQSGASSDANDAATAKATKKKNAKKKAKNKAGAAKSETNGSTGGDFDAKSPKAENEKLREMQTCKICMERAVNTTLLPCGHLVCCDTCAARLQRCPICRKRIKGTVKTFMS